MDSVTIMYNDYYTENEPDNIYVLADNNDKAVGYIIASTNYENWLYLMKTKYLEKLKKIDLKEVETLKKNLNNHETISKRPNHFHIDILPVYQRKGYGLKLLENLCHKLKEEGENHLSVVRIKKNSGSYNLCMKCGFYIFKDYGDDTVSLTKDL